MGRRAGRIGGRSSARPCSLTTEGLTSQQLVTPLKAPDPDADLVQKAAAGDGEAAAALVRKHLPRMVGLARRMLGDPAEAEDVAQEVFLRVWKAAPDWRPGAARFDTWMCRVALNLCYDRLRKRRETYDPDAGVTTPDARPNAADAWLARQRTAQVHDAIALLPERQRAAIALCHFQDMSNIEAASVLQISVEALESLLSRARRALRASLATVGRDLMGRVEDGDVG